MESRLEGKFCPAIKKECLLEGCAQYDKVLKNCATNLLALNLYKVSHAIESTVSGPPQQPPYPKYPGWK
jgi:hypothetical protein